MLNYRVLKNQLITPKVFIIYNTVKIFYGVFMVTFFILVGQYIITIFLIDTDDINIKENLKDKNPLDKIFTLPYYQQLLILLLGFFLVFLSFQINSYLYNHISENLNKKIYNFKYYSRPKEFILYARRRLNNLIIGLHNEGILLSIALLLLSFMVYNYCNNDFFGQYPYYFGGFILFYFIVLYLKYVIYFSEDPQLNYSHEHTFDAEEQEKSILFMNLCHCELHDKNEILNISAFILLLIVNFINNQKFKEEINWWIIKLILIFLLVLLNTSIPLSDLQHAWGFLDNLCLYKKLRWGKKHLKELPKSLEILKIPYYLFLGDEANRYVYNHSFFFKNDKKIHYVNKHFRFLASHLAGYFGGEGFLKVNGKKYTDLMPDFLKFVKYYHLHYYFKRNLSIRELAQKYKPNITDVKIKKILEKYSLSYPLYKKFHPNNLMELANFLFFIMEIDVPNNSFVFIHKNLLNESPNGKLLVKSLSKRGCSIITNSSKFKYKRRIII